MYPVGGVLVAERRAVVNTPDALHGSHTPIREPRSPDPTRRPGAGGQYTHGASIRRTRLLMGVHHFFWFIWEGVVVELAGR